MSESQDTDQTLLEQTLRLGTGFSVADRERVRGALAGLARHLASWRPDQVELEVSIKDREGPEQKVTLEAWLAGWPTLVATSTLSHLDSALVEARKDLIRRFEDEKRKREPSKGRASRRPS